MVFMSFSETNISVRVSISCKCVLQPSVSCILCITFDPEMDRGGQVGHAAVSGSDLQLVKTLQFSV